MTIFIDNHAEVGEMFRHPRHAAVILTLAACAAGQAKSGVAFAAGPDWRISAYPYAILDEDVTDILKNFGYNTGLRMSVAQDVRGAVHGQESSATAGEFLDELTKSNDLDWYSDGTVVYVSPASDEETAAVALNGFSFDRLRRHLADAGLLDKRFRLSKRAAGDVAILSGPPSYVAVVKQAIEAETGVGGPPDAPAAGTLVVFRGNASSSLKLP